MLVDLTHPVYPGMPVYPGDSEVDFETEHSYDSAGYRVTEVTLNTHAGTHIDAPSHYSADGITVDADAILSACVGTAIVVDIGNRPAGAEITPPDLGSALNSVGEGDRLLLASGWSGMFGSEGFFGDFPSISKELALTLAGRSIALIGVETPSLHTEYDETIHRILLSAGIVIVESLANLRLLGEGRVFFSAAPLRLKGLDGSPVRAYGIR